MNYKKIAFLVLIGLLTFAGIALAQFSPTVFSPDVVQVGPKEQCVKEAGRLKCRWGGACVKVGSACHSCGEGMQYQEGLGCYKCVAGTSLKNKNGSWVCER